MGPSGIIGCAIGKRGASKEPLPARASWKSLRGKSATPPASPGGTTSIGLAAADGTGGGAKAGTADGSTTAGCTGGAAEPVPGGSAGLGASSGLARRRCKGCLTPLCFAFPFALALALRLAFACANLRLATDLLARLVRSLMSSAVSRCSMALSVASSSLKAASV